MEIRIKPDSIGKLLEEFKNLKIDPNEEKEIEEARQKFVDYFNKDKISALSKDEYYQGRGKKTGCFTYELEWDTKRLGGIGGGSVYKFGYEKDFDTIKSFLVELLSFQDDTSSFYNDDGELKPKIIKIVDRTKKIKGLKSGRSLTGKFLRMYYPNTFIQIFNHQERFLKHLIQDYSAEHIGLELFIRNNYLLLRIKDKLLDKIPESQQNTLNNFQFMKLLYSSFPILTDKEKIIEEAEDESIEALEVEHYQSLIHRNRNKLFPDYKYFDEEYQNEHDGHFYAQEAGTIDFLFLDEKNNFVVIELKRKSTDKTLGQILRYIGWVKENLAESNQLVKGLILAESKDIYLDFALKVVHDIIQFRKINLSVSIE